MARQTTARKRIYDGIKFQSELEVFMYKRLKMMKVNADYEKHTFELNPEIIFRNKSFERFNNGKGAFKDRGTNKKITSRLYTPDFVMMDGDRPKWIIEVKGRVFKDFSFTWELFKRYVDKQGWDTVLFMPRNEADCMRVIGLLYDMKLI